MKPAMFKIADLEERCAMWRWRCPLVDIEDLQHVSSKYSPEFSVGGTSWRLHMQQRIETSTQVPYLAVHLQCLTQDPLGTYAHFKLTICNANPDAAKDKTFHCHFKKYGSAWGLHHFIQFDRLTNPSQGFIDYDDQSAGGLESQPRGGARRASQPCIIVDALIRVLLPQSDGTYAVSQLPQNVFPTAAPSPGPAIQERSAYGGSAASQSSYAGSSVYATRGTAAAPASAVSAPLQYPYEDALCDVTFSLTGGATGGVGVRAHRCIIAVRAPKLFPGGEGSLVKAGSTIDVSAIPEVFKAFLRYLYTEEPPERGILRPEFLIDLYLLAMEHELYILAEHCIQQVSPLLNFENILPIIMTRYLPTDEILNVVYLRVLAAGYDRLIEDESFESIPGNLNRRLSLVMRGKEQLPMATFPKPRGSLATNLAMLAESGAYSDYEIHLADGTSLKAHSVVLASRSISFNHALYQRPAAASTNPIPAFTEAAYAFSQPCWQRFLVAMYRGTIDAAGDITPEDVALIWKLTDAIGLDGRLRRETEPSVTTQSAVRLLVYAEKHNVPKLRDVSMRMASATFADRCRQDPGVWDVIGELPHGALLSLFRTVMTADQRP